MVDSDYRCSSDVWVRVLVPSLQEILAFLPIDNKHHKGRIINQGKLKKACQGKRTNEGAFLTCWRVCTLPWWRMSHWNRCNPLYCSHRRWGKDIPWKPWTQFHWRTPPCSSRLGNGNTCHWVLFHILAVHFRHLGKSLSDLCIQTEMSVQCQSSWALYALVSLFSMHATGFVVTMRFPYLMSHLIPISLYRYPTTKRLARIAHHSSQNRPYESRPRRGHQKFGADQCPHYKTLDRIRERQKGVMSAS